MFLDLSFINSKKKIIIALIIFLSLSLMFISLASLLGQKTFYNGVYIEGIDVSGLTKDEALIIVARKAEEICNREKIILKYSDLRWSINLRDISFKYLIEDAVDKAFSIGRTGNIFQRVRFIISLRSENINILLDPIFDIRKLENMLLSIKKQIDRETQNAAVQYKSGNINLTREIPGRIMDIDKSVKIIENEVVQRKFRDLELYISEQKPAIIYEDIKEINSLISTFSTTFNPHDTNRTHNIKLACEKINGSILKPGDVFSMNKALGPRTLENGYKDAPIIYKNELISGPGGGVCQVTTTLYGTVLKSKADVIERVHHTLPLGYVDPGQDATIAEDYIDFKFRNNMNYSLAVSAEVQGSSINIRLLGKKPDNDYIVKIKSHIIEQVLPEDEEIIIDNNIPDGERIVVREAKKGLKVQVYRETYTKNGQLIEREKISNDEYKPVKAQVKVNQNYTKQKPEALNIIP